MFRQINIQDLQPGMVIVRIIEQNGPVKIKKSGLVTSQDMVQGLIEMGVQQLEVDPQQTVEVEVAPIKKSATRRMLESSTTTSTRIDDSLSEQYHRSLFLSSAQSIPSVWQFYTKRYTLAAFVALGGLGLGWSVASYQAVLTLLGSQLNKPAVIITTAAPLDAIPVIESKQQDNKIKTAVKTDNPRDINTDVIVKSATPQTTVIADVEPGLELRSEANEVVQTITKSFKPESEPEPEPEPKISADVLARFRKAMNEVEDLPVTSVPVENTSSSEDVPRIDQLPAWVMNRLPSMAFSAHMYASIDSERWVRVNGTKMLEGDKIDGMIEIIRIEPQHVILNYSGQMFSMAALTDW